MLETIQNDFKTEDKKDKFEQAQENKEKDEDKDKDQIDFEEYLATPPEEMDYDDAIKIDKRTYCEFFSENLKERVLFANTFCENEPLKPLTLKIMVLILTLFFYFFINGFFFI